MADQLEAAQQSILSKLTGTGATTKGARTTKRKRKGMSAATKAKLSKRLKALWAARRKEGKASL